MKVKTSTKQKQKFNPVKLTIKLESQDELDAVCALFNTYQINDAFNMDNQLVEVAEKLIDHGATNGGVYFDKLQTLLK